MVAVGRNQLANASRMPPKKRLRWLTAIHTIAKARQVEGISLDIIVLCPQLLGQNMNSSMAIMAMRWLNSCLVINPVSKQIKLFRKHNSSRTGQMALVNHRESSTRLMMPIFQMIYMLLLIVKILILMLNMFYNLALDNEQVLQNTLNCILLELLLILQPK